MPSPLFLAVGTCRVRAGERGGIENINQRDPIEISSSERNRILFDSLKTWKR